MVASLYPLDDPSVLFGESFQRGPAPEAAPGTIEEVYPPDYEGTVPKRCPTKISLDVTKSRDHLVARGAVKPRHPGDEVVVRLFKRQSGEFELVATKTPKLSHPLSRYETQFNRPNAERCRIVVRFRGDASHRPSSATETFDC